LLKWLERFDTGASGFFVGKSGFFAMMTPGVAVFSGSRKFEDLITDLMYFISRSVGLSRWPTVSGTKWPT